MEKKSNTRPPIVVVLGHVDHGKTTLLDVVRKTRVTQKEAGGITQSIGASKIKTQSGREITFIDTPGHSAFSKMRGMGAKVADIAVLVVASDDGVKPQTKEAIGLIQDAKIPFVVALTKVDLATSDIDSCLGQLEKEGILFEKRGGDVPWVEVSAKENKGIGELLDTISLLADLNGLEGSENDPLYAVVIETVKDKGGTKVHAVVRSGKIFKGQNVFVGQKSFRIKNLTSNEGLVSQCTPGEAVSILGFDEAPQVGSIIKDVGCEASESGEKQNISKGQKDGKNAIILKASTKCSLDALLENLPEGVLVIDASVGDVYESDVLLAKSSGSSGIYAFESKILPQVLKLAEAEGVKVKSYKIIYELFEDLEKFILAGEEKILGSAEVIASFPFNNKKIAGCKMLSGKISKASKLRLERDKKTVGLIKAISLKKQKKEVEEVGSGEEFGILFSPQLDFALGDMLVSTE